MANNLLTNEFSYATLTEGMNAAPVAVGPVTRSHLFNENLIESTEVAIELINDELTLIQTSLRGGIGDLHPHTNRSMVKLTTSHIRTTATMLADSWINRTGFNQNGAPANVLTERDRKLTEMKARLEATLDFMKTRCLNGQILDANGDVIVDLFAEFGVVQQVVDCALDVGTTNLPNKVVAARRLSEAVLGMAYPKEWIVFASAEFIDAARAHDSMQFAAAGWSGATMLTTDHRDGSIEIAGAKMIEVANRAGKTFIEPGAAFLVPVGVPGLCTIHFAPADYVESIGQVGLPLVAKAEEMALGKGLVIEAQSNAIPVISRPRAIIKLQA